MKLLYVSSVDPKVKSGYYNAVIDRISAIGNIKNIDIKTLNYSKTSAPQTFDININKPSLLFQKWPVHYLENLCVERKIKREIAKYKPDIVHVHWAYPIGYCTIKACESLNTPCVLTCHGSDIHSNPLKSQFIAIKTKWALEKASKVIFVSNDLRIKAHSLFGDKFKSISIPNALDKGIANISSIKQPNKTAIEIAYIGNLNQTKGADLLPSILMAISKKIETAHFIIAGDGPLRKEIEAHTKKNGINVNFLGHISREHSLSIIKNSDMVLLPSRNEGFGIVALEAFTLKTPCVAFDIPGLHEVFKGNEQLLVQGKSTKDFATRATDVINGKIHADYSRYPFDYDISNTIRKEIDQYKALISH